MDHALHLLDVAAYKMKDQIQVYQLTIERFSLNEDVHAHERTTRATLTIVEDSQNMNFLIKVVDKLIHNSNN